MSVLTTDLSVIIIASTRSFGHSVNGGRVCHPLGTDSVKKFLTLPLRLRDDNCFRGTFPFPSVTESDASPCVIDSLVSVSSCRVASKRFGEGVAAILRAAASALPRHSSLSRPHHAPLRGGGGH